MGDANLISTIDISQPCSQTAYLMRCDVGYDEASWSAAEKEVDIAPWAWRPSHEAEGLGTHLIIDFKRRLAHNTLIGQDACRPDIHLLVIGAYPVRLQLCPRQLGALLKVGGVVAQHLCRHACSCSPVTSVARPAEASSQWLALKVRDWLRNPSPMSSSPDVAGAAYWSTAISARRCMKGRGAHLRSHVVEGAGAREGQLLVCPDGQAEVAQLEFQGCCQEDVLWLDVPAHPADQNITCCRFYTLQPKPLCSAAVTEANVNMILKSAGCECRSILL